MNKSRISMKKSTIAPAYPEASAPVHGEFYGTWTRFYLTADSYTTSIARLIPIHGGNRYFPLTRPAATLSGMREDTPSASKVPLVPLVSLVPFLPSSPSSEPRTNSQCPIFNKPVTFPTPPPSIHPVCWCWRAPPLGVWTVPGPRSETARQPATWPRVSLPRGVGVDSQP